MMRGGEITRGWIILFPIRDAVYSKSHQCPLLVEASINQSKFTEL